MLEINAAGDGAESTRRFANLRGSRKAYTYTQNVETRRTAYTALLDSQKLELVQFLLSETVAPGNSPLPILGDKDNRRRVDPEEPVETTGVYRDLWERNPLGIDEQDRRLKDVIDFIDFPTDEDLEQAQDRAADRRERLLFERYGLGN